MIKVRQGVFETNSSSTHSITMCKTSDFEDWKAGKLYLFINKYWWETDIDYTGFETGKFYPVEKVKAWYKDHNTEMPNSEELEDDDSGQLVFFTYEDYWDYFPRILGIEYSNGYIEESFDGVTAFGIYGHD